MKKLSFLLMLVLIAGSVIGAAAQDTDIDRWIGIDVNEAEGEDYDAAFALATEIGAGEVGISLDWNQIETAPGEYDATLFDIMNVYYPAYDMPVSLTLRPVHTGTLQVPRDLRRTAFDDPEMIARFNALLDFAFEKMPDVEFSSIVIGSELDGYLGNNARRWEQYTSFARQTADHARSLRPGVPVAFEAMYAGFTGPAAEHLQTLNEHADVIGLSYYPTNPDFTVRPPSTIADDLAPVLADYPGRPFFIYQYGYPSSEELGSSEELQAAFIRETFTFWDAHPAQIQMIDFTWLTEQSPQTVREFEAYYSFSSPAFSAFLGSLGLRHYDGTPKLALTALREEAAAHGF